MQSADVSQKAISVALEVMDRHLSAWNEQNTLQMAATMHFTNFRLIGTSLKVRKTADRYFNDFTARALECCAYTKLISVKPISVTANKVYLDIRVNGFNNPDQMIASIKSILVINKINAVWVAQLRSSFAPA